MKNRLFIGIILLLLICTSRVVAQVDTTFWFAAPYFNSIHGQDASYRLVVFSFDSAATVSVSMPANPSFVPVVTTIGANSFTEIILANNKADGDATITTPFNTITQRGLLITSTSKIECYYQIDGDNSEAFTLKGKNALGTDFLVTGQKTYDNGTSGVYSDSRCSIHIVASEDNTTVVFYPSGDILLSDGSSSSGTVSVTLNKGETYSIASYSNSASDNLVGTTIQSDKPIAVTLNDDSVEKNGNGDTVGEQLIPTDFAGTNYVVVSRGTHNDICTVFALHDNTSVTTSTGESFSLNQGGYYTISMNGINALSVQSSAPIMVFQTLTTINGSGELGGTVVPHIECTGSQVAGYKTFSSDFSVYINLITRKKNIADFTINGIPIASSDFHPVDTSDNYYYAIIPKTASPTPYVVQCSSGFFQMGVTEGNSGGSSTYGFFSNYGTFYLHDEYDSFIEGRPYTWLNHFMPDGVTPMIFAEEGVYADTLTAADGCDSIRILHLTQIPCDVTYSDTTAFVCEGGSLEWYGQTYNTTADIPTILTNAAGCDSIRTLHLIVHPTVYSDTAMLVCDTLLPIRWYEQAISAAGTYQHMLSAANGCDSIVTLTVTVETCIPPQPVCDTLKASLLVPDICADDDSLYINISYTHGLPVGYTATFETKAVEQGFSASYQGDVQLTSGSTAVIAIAVPGNTNRQNYPRPNVYKIDVSLTDACNATATWTSQEFTIHYPSWIMLQRWEDVISLYNEQYNGGYTFSDIRWYHEGTLIDGQGEHNGYIYQPPHLNFGEAYWAELTRADDGVTITTCPIYPVSPTDAPSVTADKRVFVTPTVITPGTPFVTVQTTMSGEYSIYTPNGQLLHKQHYCPNEANRFIIGLDDLHTPAGMLILIFRSEEGTIDTQRILIEK